MVGYGVVAAGIVPDRNFIFLLLTSTEAAGASPINGSPILNTRYLGFTLPKRIRIPSSKLPVGIDCLSLTWLFVAVRIPPRLLN